MSTIRAGTRKNAAKNAIKTVDFLENDKWGIPNREKSW